MTSVDITKTEVNEVIMRDNPKEICIDGKLLDLSKVQSVKIEFDYNGIEIDGEKKRTRYRWNIKSLLISIVKNKQTQINE